MQPSPCADTRRPWRPSERSSTCVPPAVPLAIRRASGLVSVGPIRARPEVASRSDRAQVGPCDLDIDPHISQGLATLDLTPLDRSHYDLIRALEEQEDVWESLGPLPPPDEQGAHLFAVVEGRTPIGVGGLVPSQALGSQDFELFCALLSEAQTRGLATQACQLILTWAFANARLDRVIASIDDENEGAKSIATKLGMKPFRAIPRHRTVYVRARTDAAP